MPFQWYDLGDRMTGFPVEAPKQCIGQRLLNHFPLCTLAGEWKVSHGTRGPLYQFYAQLLKKKDNIESEIQSQESISSEENGF